MSEPVYIWRIRRQSVHILKKRPFLISPFKLVQYIWKNLKRPFFTSQYINLNFNLYVMLIWSKRHAYLGSRKLVCRNSMKQNIFHSKSSQISEQNINLSQIQRFYLLETFLPHFTCALNLRVYLFPKRLLEENCNDCSTKH